MISAHLAHLFHDLPCPPKARGLIQEAIKHLVSKTDCPSEIRQLGVCENRPLAVSTLPVKSVGHQVDRSTQICLVSAPPLRLGWDRLLQLLGLTTRSSFGVQLVDGSSVPGGEKLQESIGAFIWVLD